MAGNALKRPASSREKMKGSLPGNAEGREENEKLERV